jgi:hypothetical protein
VAGSGVNYGFANVTDSAQGNSVKADQYLFWDDVHPTTYGHYQIACEAYTLLTGTPVLEISQSAKHIDRNTGERAAFLITRTGTDFSATLDVPFVTSGDAVEGTDYKTLKTAKTLNAGVQTAEVKIKPTTTAAGAASVKVKLTLQAGTGYVLPVQPTAAINLDTSEP